MRGDICAIVLGDRIPISDYGANHPSLPLTLLDLVPSFCNVCLSIYSLTLYIPAPAIPHRSHPRPASVSHARGASQVPGSETALTETCKRLKDLVMALAMNSCLRLWSEFPG